MFNVSETVCTAIWRGVLSVGMTVLGVLVINLGSRVTTLLLVTNRVPEEHAAISRGIESNANKLIDHEGRIKSIEMQLITIWQLEMHEHSAGATIGHPP